MSNDLVRYSGLIDDDTAAHHARPTPDREGYDNALDNIDDAERRHDHLFRATREADAADAVQDRWGSGDVRTWAIIWAMFFGFLLFCWFVYALPAGPHYNPSSIRVY